MADLSHRLRTPITALRLDVDGVEDREQASALASRVDDLAGQLDAVVRAARPRSRASRRIATPRRSFASGPPSGRCSPRTRAAP